MQYRILRFEELDTNLLYEILAHRMEVFVLGQRAIYRDLDSKDQIAWHLLAIDESGTLQGYCRILPASAGHATASFGRLSVKETMRRQGLGAEIVRLAIAFLTKELGCTEVEISAMAYLRDFYETLGFTTTSEVFQIENVPHILMMYKC